MKPYFKSQLLRLDKQFFSALLIFLLLSMLLIILFFRNVQHIQTQLAYLIGIAILALCFSLFSLWKLNQAKGWVSVWANHPLWVILTFLVFPCFLILLWNSPLFSNIPPAEFTQPVGRMLLPHFLFTYFWQTFVFGIAFLAHPDLKIFSWRLSGSEVLLGLLLGLGSWGGIMFANEILLQEIPATLPYLNQAPAFGALLPIALFVTPITTGFLFFYSLPLRQEMMPPLLAGFVRIFFFCLLPFRIISLLPAFLFSLLFNIFIIKKGPVPALMIAYAIFNLCIILINWQWVL